MHTQVHVRTSPILYMFTLAQTLTAVVSVGFANSCYVMTAGQANVCLAIVNDVQLLSNFSLRLSLNNDGLCTPLPPFVFKTNSTTGSIACARLFRERTIIGCFNISYNTSCQTDKINSSFGGLSTAKVCRRGPDDCKSLSYLLPACRVAT